MSDIKRIGYTIAHYQKTDNGRLRKYIIHQFGQPTEQEIQDAQEFILTYLGFVQPSLEHLEVAAHNALRLSIIQPIIDDCIDYFKKTNDHINEHQHGLYGLLDDAYRALKLVGAVKDIISNIELPFDTEQLNQLNKTVQIFLPEAVIQKIDAEVGSISAELLIHEVKGIFNQKEEITSTTVSFSNGKLDFPFVAYPILSDLSIFKEKKGIYAYTRLQTQNDKSKSIHSILYISTTSDISTIQQQEHLTSINQHQPTHICIYTYSQDNTTILSWATSLIQHYRPPFNKTLNPFSQVAINPSIQSRQNNRNTSLQMKNCSSCYGSGKTTCSSCNGSGGRAQSRVEYDWEGRANYLNEWISCSSCSGGYSTCFVCGGKGEV